MSESPIRKPVAPRRPPTIIPPAPGAVLEYRGLQRRKKVWFKRLYQHIRYHYEDRVGNAIMFGGAVIGMTILLAILRPSTWLLLLRYLSHQ